MSVLWEYQLHLHNLCCSRGNPLTHLELDTTCGATWSLSGSTHSSWTIPPQSLMPTGWNMRKPVMLHFFLQFWPLKLCGQNCLPEFLGNIECLTPKSRPVSCFAGSLYLRKVKVHTKLALKPEKSMVLACSCSKPGFHLNPTTLVNIHLHPSSHYKLFMSSFPQVWTSIASLRPPG